MAAAVLSQIILWRSGTSRPAMQRAKINIPMQKRRLKAQLETGSFVEIRSTAETLFRLPTDDNTPESLRALQAANAHFRTVRWPG